MILANKLQYGDTIAFFSPSSAVTHFAPKRFARAKDFLAKKGFNLVAGNLTGKSDYYRSGSIQARADELNALIADKNVFGIYSKIGLVTFYGSALVASFGEIGRPLDLTFQYFNNALINTNAPYKIDNPKFWTDEFIEWEQQTEEKQLFDNQLISVNSGKATGRLIAGNLSTMAGIYGSEYMPTINEGDILLIEDSLKSSSAIERSFSHLKINGIFDKIGGLILGCVPNLQYRLKY